jgi:hypothetical protein
MPSRATYSAFLCINLEADLLSMDAHHICRFSMSHLPHADERVAEAERGASVRIIQKLEQRLATLEALLSSKTPAVTKTGGAHQEAKSDFATVYAAW